MLYAKRRIPPDLTSYASLFGESFSYKVNLLGSIVQGLHYPSVGRYKERVLAEAIRQYIPDGFSVGNGFVLFPIEFDAENQPPVNFDPLNMSRHVLSRECDIIVYDSTSAPVIFKDQDFVIVRPEVVKAIVEVKGSLSPSEITKTLESFLDFGKKWRATQFFYKAHSQPTSPRPSLHLMAWDVSKGKNGKPKTDGTRFRRQVCKFYREKLSSTELTCMPTLNQGFIYNDCEVSASSIWVEASKSAMEGWTTSPGKFIRCDESGDFVFRGDRTIASLLAHIHYSLRVNFNRFFSYPDEIRFSNKPAYEHSGYDCWLDNADDMRACNTDEP